MHHKNIYFAFITGRKQPSRSRLLSCCTRTTQLQTIHHLEQKWQQHYQFITICEKRFLYLCRGNQEKHLLTKQSFHSEKICGWLSDAVSAESKVAKWRWDLAAVKGQRKGLVSAAVMTNFLCSDLSEVSHEPPQWEKCSDRFHGKPPKNGGTCCFNERPVSWTGCLFGSLVEWVLPRIAGKLDCVFLWMLFWFVLTGWLLKLSFLIAEC